MLTCLMGVFIYAEKADMHYMHDSANGHSRDMLQMYHVQFHDQRILDHRIFQQLHCQLSEADSFHLTDMKLANEELSTFQNWKKAS